MHYFSSYYFSLLKHFFLCVRLCVCMCMYMYVHVCMCVCVCAHRGQLFGVSSLLLGEFQGSNLGCQVWK